MPTRKALPPGPRGVPLLGYLPTHIRDPLGSHLRLAREYGPITHAAMGPVSLYFVNAPELIEELLLGHAAECIKDPLARDLIPMLGLGLFTSEGEHWKRQRRLAAPPMQPKRIGVYADTFVDCAERTFGALREGEQLQFQGLSSALTLEIVGKTLLGMDTRAQTQPIAQAVSEAQMFLERRLYSLTRLVPAWLPLPSAVRFRRAVARLDAIIYAHLDQVAKSGTQGEHLLARLMEARDEHGEPMTRRQLRDEVVTMLLAGHESTALSLMFSVYLLASHPEHYARAIAEVDAALQGHPAKLGDLPKLRFVDAIVRESLRLYPPVYAFAREVVQPFELGGYRLDPGNIPLVSPYASHRDARFFPEPDHFKPERWLGPETENLPRFAYFPFGGGPRVCIGNHFAALEAVLILTTLLKHVQLQVAPGFELKLAPAVTLRSRDGLPVRVLRRRSPQGERVQAASPGL